MFPQIATSQSLKAAGHGNESIVVAKARVAQRPRDKPRLACPRTESGLDNQLVEVLKDIAQFGGLAAPPRRDRRYQKLFPEQVPA